MGLGLKEGQERETGENRGNTEVGGEKRKERTGLGKTVKTRREKTKSWRRRQGEGLREEDG